MVSLKRLLFLFFTPFQLGHSLCPFLATLRHDFGGVWNTTCLVHGGIGDFCDYRHLLSFFVEFANLLVTGFWLSSFSCYVLISPKFGLPLLTGITKSHGIQKDYAETH